MTHPPFTIPITVVTRTKTGVDSYGDDVYGETPTVVQGVFAPADANGTGGNELTDARDTVIIGAAVYLPASVDPSAFDAVVVGGVKFEVNGQPQRWDLQPHPFTGWVPALPVVVPLKRVEG